MVEVGKLVMNPPWSHLDTDWDDLGSRGCLHLDYLYPVESFDHGSMLGPAEHGHLAGSPGSWEIEQACCFLQLCLPVYHYNLDESVLPKDGRYLQISPLIVVLPNLPRKAAPVGPAMTWAPALSDPLRVHQPLQGFRRSRHFCSCCCEASSSSGSYPG